MGYLTTVTFYNDAFDIFEKNPKEFGEKILNGTNEANRAYKAIDIGMGCHANCITIQPSYHADAHQLYIHSGNTVFNINPWSRDFEDLLKSNLSCAEDWVAQAESMIEEANKKVKEAKKNLDGKPGKGHDKGS